MPALLEFQHGVREAMVHGRIDAIAPLLAGGGDPRGRLAVHQRHYAASLARAVVERFPATAWLVGSELVVDAARRFIRDHPPERPCIAEYGEGFPRALGAHPAAAQLPYLAPFAELEWHAGRLALATESSPHVHYLHLDWPVDELLTCYLTDTAPDRFVLSPCDTWLEVRGRRGELFLTRVEEPVHV
ncbi:MAG: DNA-binding domain-containing protein [Vicinamibacterales bacterium]